MYSENFPRKAVRVAGFSTMMSCFIFSTVLAGRRMPRLLEEDRNEDEKALSL